MFLQPWVGSRSDRTHTRFGRRKPWLMLGAPLAALFFILVPFVRENFVLIALAILGTNLAMALFRSPTIAYLGDLFKPAERSKANGVINLMGGVGGAIALFAGGALYKIGVPIPFIFGAAVLLIAIAIVLWQVQDPPVAPSAEADAAPEPTLWQNIKQVATDADRSGLFLLGAIFSWFVGWNATEAFFTLYAREHPRPGSGDGHPDVDGVRRDADPVLHPQRPDRHPYRPQAHHPDRAGRDDGRNGAGLLHAQPDSSC